MPKVTDSSYTIPLPDGGADENFLMSYSEEERQENEINKANAELVYKNKYFTIPYQVFQVGLSGNDAIIFAFLTSFHSRTGRLYISNQKIAEMFNISENTVTNVLKKLSGMGLINMSYKRKIDGGQIRFINLNNEEKNSFEPRDTKIVARKSQKLGGINIKTDYITKQLTYSAKRKEKINKREKKKFENFENTKLPLDPLLPEGFPDFLNMSDADYPKSEEEGEALMELFSHKETPTESKDKLAPCSMDELIHLGKTKRIYYDDVLRKYEEMITLINNGEFVNKRGKPYGKTTYYTLNNWLNMAIENKKIQKITDESEYQAQYGEPFGLYNPVMAKQDIMIRAIRRRHRRQENG